MPSFGGATGWINTTPLTFSALRGKVVLVEFWTYTCVNWRRESPYVRAWASRYKDHGLVVVGVHSPEFDFEKDIENVRRATKNLGIDYPVALDAALSVWSTFENEYWPALYFIDANGRMRGRHFGEGDYDQDEHLIRRLLLEAGATDLGSEPTAVVSEGAEAAADTANLGSPESYLGYGHGNNLATPQGIRMDVSNTYVQPARLRLNQWALAGEWIVREGSIVSTSASARVAYLFHARDVNLVIGQSRPRSTLRFRILIDGKPPGAAHGVDVDAEGIGSVVEPRMYQLVRQPGRVVDRLFEIEFLDPGAEAFDFTFG